MRLHSTPAKAVTESHRSKPFDTVLPVGADTLLVGKSGHNLSGVRSRRLSNTLEYVAICVDMEGASTSKKRRKEVRQRKDYIRNATQLFNDQCLKCNASQMMMDCPDIFCEQAHPVISVEIDSGQ